MPTIELTILRPHADQAQVLAGSTRFNVLSAGRRWGKSTFGQERVIEVAIQGYPVAWFAPSYKLLTEAWRELRTTLAGILARDSFTEKRMELVTGGVIEFWTLDNPDAGRSRKYKRVFIDEAGLVPHLQDVWEAAIRPTLTDYQGDAWFGGTPKGRNYFWRLYQRGQDPEQTEWASWQRPTSANPHLPAEEIDAARDELPAATFQQEYLAEFLESEGSVFRRIREAATATKGEPAPGDYVMGVDWAQSRDFTVLAVIDRDTCRMVDMDRFNHLDWATQRGRLTAMVERWGVARIIAEENSIGSPNIEALQREGLPVIAFTTTAMSKPPLIESLVLAFERSEIAILDDPVLVGELEAYERQVSPTTGRSRYNAPVGMHDDTVMALALAWHGVTSVPSSWIGFA